jgi:PGAP1-like protein
VKQTAIHPIIYVRGYAMTQNEIEDTVADPYMGFNIGSAKVRQLWDGTVKKFFFESPLVRLMKQFNYDDVYEEGMDQVVDQRAERKSVPYRSVIIYRYYEPSSQDIGTSEKPSIDRFAQGLSDLILSLRKRIYPQGKDTPIVDGMLPYDSFRVYLVAHSMGGLVCRAFLQNPKYGDEAARKLVDKVFTYATPHNGIEVVGLGNVPSWLSFFGIDTFNRDTMAAI